MKRGPLLEKTYRKKNYKKKKEKKEEKKLFIHIWNARALHMLKGLNVDTHFGKEVQ